MTQKRICLGEIVGAHGIKGEVKVRSFCAEPEALANYASLQDEAGSPCRLTLRSVSKAMLVARVAGIEDRDAAEKLAKAKARLYVTRAELGEAEEGSYFIEDLKGLRALDGEGNEIARVKDVANYGAGDILILQGEKEFMLPLKPPFAQTIDLAAGTLRVMVPEGWLDTKKGAPKKNGEKKP